MSHCAGAFPTLCCAAWPLPLAPGNSHLLQPLILNPFLVLCRHISLFIVSSAITAWLYLHSTCKAVVLEQSRMQNWLGWSCTTSLSVCASPQFLVPPAGSSAGAGAARVPVSAPGKENCSKRSFVAQDGEGTPVRAGSGGSLPQHWQIWCPYVPVQGALVTHFPIDAWGWCSGNCNL